MMMILEKYGQASGQIINIEKSTIMFSPNTSSSTKATIQQRLQISMVSQFDRYLGLPARIGRLKREVLNYLKDRLCARINGWGSANFPWRGWKCSSRPFSKLYQPM